MADRGERLFLWLSFCAAHLFTVCALSFVNPHDVFLKELPEDTAIGTNVISVVASASSPTYSISQQSPPTPAFTSTLSGGLFQLLTPELDYESVKKFEITVRVVEGIPNGGSLDSPLITVVVTDVNEAPSINTTSFTKELLPTDPAGTTVVTVFASDEDVESPNNDLVFTISAGNDDGHFKIDASSGEITVSDSATLTPGLSVILTVSVSDSGTPSLTAADQATITITVKVIDCEQLTAPNNGFITYTPAGTYTYETVATYDCNAGFNLSGGPSRTCQANGQWSGAAASCDAVNCGPLTAVDHGSITYEPPGETTYQATATIACDTGYEMSGQSTRTCEDSGDWSGTAPTCTIVDCGILTVPDHGSITYTPSETYTYQANATYQCAWGYQLFGQATRTCQANGTWSDTPSNCSYVRSSGQTTASLVIVVASAGGVVVVIAVLATVFVVRTYTFNSRMIHRNRPESKPKRELEVRHPLEIHNTNMPTNWNHLRHESDMSVNPLRLPSDISNPVYGHRSYQMYDGRNWT